MFSDLALDFRFLDMVIQLFNVDLPAAYARDLDLCPNLMHYPRMYPSTLLRLMNGEINVIPGESSLILEPQQSFNDAVDCLTCVRFAHLFLSFFYSISALCFSFPRG